MSWLTDFLSGNKTINVNKLGLFDSNTPPIDFNKAATYARQFGDGTSYALDFEQNGKKYTYIPSNLAQNGGVTAGDNTYLLPYFTDQKNLESFSNNSQKVDLSNTTIANYLKNQGQSTQGFLIPTDKAAFDSDVRTQPTSTLDGSLNGLKKVGDQIVYGVTGGGGSRYLTTSGEVHNPTTTYSSILGDVFGSAGQDLANAWQDLGPIGQVAALYYGGSALSEALGASSQAGALTGTDAAMADLAASSPAFSGAAPTAFAGALPEGFSSTLPVPGPPVQVASTLPGAGLESLSPAVEGMGGAQGLKASQGLGTNLAASSGNLAEMGAAQGLGGGTTLSGLAEMGGAQGLVAGASALPLIGAIDAGTNLASGEVLGAAGAGGALTPAAAGIGAGLGLSQAATGAGSALAGTAAGSALGSAAGAAGGAAAGSALSDILPYTAGAGVLGGYLQSNAAKEAAQIQADAANKALAQQQANFELINAQQAPYRGLGYQGINTIRSMLPGNNVIYDEQGKAIGTGIGSDYLTRQFTPQDFAAGIDPGYAFRLQQGQMANQRAANVGGGALSGNTLQGLNKYSQDLASQEYGNAFNRYQTQRSNIYNTLANIAGIGQTGQTATNQASTNLANAATNLGVGSAAAQAAGGVGSAQAYTNAINNATNNYTLASLLNQRGNVVA